MAASFPWGSQPPFGKGKTLPFFKFAPTWACRIAWMNRRHFFPLLARIEEIAPHAGWAEEERSQRQTRKGGLLLGLLAR
jgi:hypothetical protein